MKQRAKTVEVVEGAYEVEGVEGAYEVEGVEGDPSLCL
jgi:hypothetical protein